jgi:hypothetical protein
MGLAVIVRIHLTEMRPVPAMELSDALCNVPQYFLSLQVVHPGILSDEGEERSFVVRID